MATAFSRFKYHFVFYILNEQLKPLIIGVIHEQRDIVKHLSERLDLTLPVQIK